MSRLDELGDALDSMPRSARYRKKPPSRMQLKDARRRRSFRRRVIYWFMFVVVNALTLTLVIRWGSGRFQTRVIRIGNEPTTETPDPKRP